MTHASSANVNPDLGKERTTATFDPLQMTYFIDGSVEKTRNRRHWTNLAVTDPGFHGPDPNFLSRNERYTLGIKKYAHLISKFKELDFQDPENMMIYEVSAFGGRAGPLSLHRMAFQNAIAIMGDEEQCKKWLPLCKHYGIIGAYAQTELSHGSNIRGLQTVAEYDPKTDNFVLNTPNLESTKWWSGTLGKSATHALVMAQLLTKGQNHGLHPFIVHIRDMVSHEPLRGITVGDIGPKFGINEVDNGYMQLKDVRIPRDNLLHRTGSVTRDGTYVKPTNEKAVYGSMTAIRVGIPRMSAQMLSTAVTIAIRYSCVRRQSELKPGDREPQIIEFQTQQHKLFPHLAAAYAYTFAAKNLRRLSEVVQIHITQNNFSKLPELHSISSALKSRMTTTTQIGIETCRLSCGGHGFSHASGLPALYQEHAAPTTAEGEITVLYLQAARYLLKSYMRAQEGKPLDETVQFLTRKELKNISGDSDHATLTHLVDLRAKWMIEDAAGRLQVLIGEGKSQHEALGLTMQPLVEAAIAYADSVITNSFLHAILQCEFKSLQPVLGDLFETFALNRLINDAGDYMIHGTFTSSQVGNMRSRLYSLYRKLRPNAVSLVDAFDIHDQVHNSVLGRYDGNVYENMYKWAQQSSLNKTQVHESYYKYIQPFQREMKSKM